MMNLEDFVDRKQQQEIITIIQTQCHRFQEQERQFQSLFYGPYVTMRHKYSLTSAVLSGFTPNTAVSGFQIDVVHYGLNDMLCQPELRSKKAIVQIYSDGSNLNSKVFKDRCAKYNHDLTTMPVFLPFVFYANVKQGLNRIIALLPDKEGKPVSQYSIYEMPKLAVMSA